MAIRAMHFILLLVVLVPSCSTHEGYLAPFEEHTNNFYEEYGPELTKPTSSQSWPDYSLVSAIASNSIDQPGDINEVMSALKRILSDRVMDALTTPAVKFEKNQIRGNKRQAYEDSRNEMANIDTELSLFETPVEEINRLPEQSTTTEQEVVIPRHFEEEKLLWEYGDEYSNWADKNEITERNSDRFWEKNPNDLGINDDKETKIHTKSNFQESVKPSFDRNVLQHITNGNNEKWKQFSILKNFNDDDEITVQDITHAETENLNNNKVKEYFKDELPFSGDILGDKFKNIQETKKDKLLHGKAFTHYIFNDYEGEEYWNKYLIMPQTPLMIKNDNFLENSHESNDGQSLVPEYVKKTIQTEKESNPFSGITTPLRTDFRLINIFEPDILSTTMDTFKAERLFSISTSLSTQPKTIRSKTTTLGTVLMDYKTIKPETTVSLPQSRPTLTSNERTDNKTTETHPTRSKIANDLETDKHDQHYMPIHLGIFKKTIQVSNFPTTMPNTDTCAPTNETTIFSDDDSTKNNGFEYLDTLTILTHDKLSSLISIRHDTNYNSDMPITLPNHPKQNSFDLSFLRGLDEKDQPVIDFENFVPSLMKVIKDTVDDSNKMDIVPKLKVVLDKEMDHAPTCGFGTIDTTETDEDVTTSNSSAIMSSWSSTKPDTDSYDYDTNMTGIIMGKCYVCGLDEERIPISPICGEMFGGPMFDPPPDEYRRPHYEGKQDLFKKYCRYMDVRRVHMNASNPKSLWGRFTGGCSFRLSDISSVYTQRACRIRNKPMMGRHSASKRMAKLEEALNEVDNGCIVSPMATLLPLSRSISLFSKFTACVCTGSWCNTAHVSQNCIKNIIVSSLISVINTL